MTHSGARYRLVILDVAGRRFTAVVQREQVHRVPITSQANHATALTHMSVVLERTSPLRPNNNNNNKFMASTTKMIGRISP